MKLTKFLILPLFLFISCKKKEIIKNKEYCVFFIKNHYTLNRIDRDVDREIKGTFILDKSCEYELTNNIGQVNKLVGIGINKKHQENSLRIGWEFMPEGKYFKLWAYYYINGERNQEIITTCESNEEVNFSVMVSDNQYLININNFSFTKEVDLNITNTELLLPYFGGKEPFPGSLHNDKKCKISISFE